MEPPPPPPPPSIRCWTDIVQKPPLPKPPEPSISNRVLFNSCKSSKGIAVAVVDANAIIQRGDKLTSCADKFVSVREVLAEVRDPASRHHLEFMPFTVDIMEPTPEALNKVINFARATGDLQTLSDVDLKLIALAYTLEAQIHGTNHLRDSPPPLHMVNLKRLPEKDMPGWGSNVPNLAEWEALENAVELSSDFSSRILPLKDLSLNILVDGHGGSGDVITESRGNIQAENQENGDHGSRKTRRFMRPKREIKIEGKKMVADGIDASQGEGADDSSDWMPAVSRSTHRRYLRRKARHELAESSEKLGQPDEANTDAEITESVPDIVPEENRSHLTEATLPESSKGTQVTNVISKDEEAEVSTDRDDDISTILKHMRLEADFSKFDQDEQEPAEIGDAFMGKDTLGNENIVTEGELLAEGLHELEISDISSRTDESMDTSVVDDNSSEQSCMLRSLSDSSVACVTSDFAMQNVILQIGLRLLAPGGMQIRQLHRWILKCHACNKVTSEIGRIFCPKCGNGGTLRKVSVTVGENGIVQAARRPRITLRGTKFSLPLPQGGRDAITKNLILREDQLPHKVLYPKMKKKPNKEGLEFLSSDDVFSHTSDKRAPFKPPIRKALAVFSGRRNPNDNHFSRRKY